MLEAPWIFVTTSRILRRRWALIAACVLVAIGAAALFTLRSTPVYASTAKLYVSTSGTRHRRAVPRRPPRSAASRSRTSTW